MAQAQALSGLVGLFKPEASDLWSSLVASVCSWYQVTGITLCWKIPASWAYLRLVVLPLSGGNQATPIVRKFHNWFKHPIPMAEDNGNSVSQLSKIFKGNDSSKSPPASQPETPISTKRQLGTEADQGNGLVFKLDLLRILDEESKSQNAATLALLFKDKDRYKGLRWACWF